MINIKHILYATDFSPHSNQAYFHAIALAEGHGAALTILHVYTPKPIGMPGMEPATEEEGLGISYWRAQLEQIRPVNDDIRVRHVLLEGDPAKEIIHYAMEEGIDLIVMGTHGRTGLERLLMGSVAENVVRGAPCSVLVAKMAKRVPASEKTKTAAEPAPIPAAAMPSASLSR